MKAMPRWPAMRISWKPAKRPKRTPSILSVTSAGSSVAMSMLLTSPLAAAAVAAAAAAPPPAAAAPPPAAAAALAPPPAAACVEVGSTVMI